MAPKKNKQREKLEQSQASSRAKAHESLRATTSGFVGFSSFAKPQGGGGGANVSAVNPFAAFAGGAPAAYSASVYGGGVEDAASAIYDGADHEIAMALKMLGKKGTVTKLKALNSFLTEILPHKKPPEVRGMVGHFVQLYTFEVRDQKDRKVRQMLNEVLLALTTKLKPKAFAPHFRRLLPYWLMAMHDPNAEAAVAANKALGALFPENEEMQAEIIVTHLNAVMEEYSTFFQHTPDTFPGVTLPESDEREERYERCVAAAVLSIERIVNLFAATGNVAKLSDGDQAFTVASVVSSDKFGRLVSASSKNPNFTRDGIRKATYRTMKSLVVSAFAIVQAREEYFGKLILGALSDKYPANQHDMWDMVLTFLQTSAATLWVQNESQSISKFLKSAVLPRLFAQIRHGFYGSARSSFPVLLPLLSMIPLEHVVDSKSGTCALYTGVVENAWKFLFSNESRFYEDLVIQSTFECVRTFFDYFLRSPSNRDAAAQLFRVSGEKDAPCSQGIVSVYVGQFEKLMRDSLTSLFTSPKFSSQHVKTYAKEWSIMVTKLQSANDEVSGLVAKHFVGSAQSWLSAVLEELPSNASVQADRVNVFLKILVGASPSSQSELLASSKKMYSSCLIHLGDAKAAPHSLKLMNGLFDIFSADIVELREGAQSFEDHYEHHIRPQVIAAGSVSTENLSAESVSVALRAARQFFLFAHDKKAFILQLFQDFAVQYGDMAKASLMIESCFRFPFSSNGANEWLGSGSFHRSDTERDSTDEHPLRAVWKGKLVDEFVMISLKGRLDDHDGETFSSLLKTCLGGEKGMPLVSPDAVVILSHFVSQQTDSQVSMRILPSLVTLFSEISEISPPAELQSAEDEAYRALFRLAATSDYKAEAEAIWKRNVPTAVGKWNQERRSSFINALANEVNGVFTSNGDTTTTYSPKVWASFVEQYLELATLGSEDDSCSSFALINRLTIFDLRFEGSRLQLTTMYDRLLACLVELCEDDETGASTVRFTGFFDQLFAHDSERGLKLLHRLIDIDMCHGLTLAILQTDSLAPFSRNGVASPIEFLSLRPLYNSIAAHLPKLYDALTGGRSDDVARPRYRKVIFMNQHMEPQDDADMLQDLSETQHAELDRQLTTIVSSFLPPSSAAKKATAWCDDSGLDRAPAPIEFIVKSELESEHGAAVALRVTGKCGEFIQQWPRPIGMQAMKVFTSCWADEQAAQSVRFDSAVHHPLLLKISRAFATSSPSTLEEWFSAAAYLISMPSAWDGSESLEDTKKRWSLAARGLVTHALAGKTDISEIARLRPHKRILPAASDEVDHEDDLVVSYSQDLARSRSLIAQLVQSMSHADGGEGLQELAGHHREALLSTVLIALAEGLYLKSHVVPVYLNATSSTTSLTLIQLTAEIDALLDSATRTLPSLLTVIHDVDRVRAIFLEAFLHVKGIAACFNTDKTTTPLHVRVMLYTICTYTKVFHPSGGVIAGIDINADDEDATEAALAKSIIPAGLRAALKVAFHSRENANQRGKRSKRRQRRQDEEDEIVGRLLVWDLFAQLFPDSGARDGEHLGMRSSALSAYVAKNGLLSSYLTLCGQLLSRETGSQSVVSKLKIQDAPLYEIADLNDTSLAWVDDIDAVSLGARSFFRTVLRLPAMVRTWWNDECTRSLRSWASKYFEEHVTPYVLASELDIIQKASSTHSWDAEEMTVKGSKVSREITTTYVKDECALEMVIRVPASYPLRSVEVECTRRIGITEDRWRRWVLQIIKVTSAQDGSLLDAVLLWKQNVDKEFEGVEPCPICYSILNPKTMGLPNLSCKTCSNKYHNSCLYKWFNQSGKNKCPICQQPFT